MSAAYLTASSVTSSQASVLPIYRSKLDAHIDVSISREMRPEIMDNHPNDYRSIKIPFDGISPKECIIDTFNKINECILDNGTIIIINYSKMRYEILLYNWEIFETFIIFFNIYIYKDGIIIEYDTKSNTKTHGCVNIFIYDVYELFNKNILLRQYGITQENNIYYILCQLFNEDVNNIKKLIKKASIRSFPDFDDFSHADHDALGLAAHYDHEDLGLAAHYDHGDIDPIDLDDLGALDDFELDELALEMDNLNSIVLKHSISKIDSDFEKFKKLINLMPFEEPFKFIIKPTYNFIELYLMSKLNTDINNELQLIYLMLNSIKNGDCCINIYLLCDILKDNYVYYLNHLPIRKKLYELLFTLKEDQLMYQLTLPIDNILNSYKIFMINKSRTSYSTLSRFFNHIPDEIFHYIKGFLPELV